MEAAGSQKKALAVAGAAYEARKGGDERAFPLLQSFARANRVFRQEQDCPDGVDEGARRRMAERGGGAFRDRRREDAFNSPWNAYLLICTYQEYRDRVLRAERMGV